MDAAQIKMLKAIQALSFTAIELTLYLDTHPGDQKALADHNMVSQQLQMATKEYELKYGPLTLGAQSKYPWQWIEEPWPWEIEY